MNLEEKSNTSICQQETSNNAASILPEARSENFLSPTRRSSRIRKPKISSDYCSIDEAIEENRTNPKIKEQAMGKSKQHVSTPTSSEVNFIHCNRDIELSKSHRSLEKSSLFFQTDNDEESFESMFDDIFGQRYTKTLQSLLPKKLSSGSIKERKFFKRNSQESPKPNLSECYSSNKSNLPTEDVDKVFKIISKPNILSDMPSDSKTPGKPSLKTYCNKRKTFQKSNVVESFGLPDYPVIPENVIKPILNDKLDAEILDASEITILDSQFINDPWVATNIEDENLFPFYEEVRMKAEPDKHERVRKNSSFIDPSFIENSDLCNEFNIFTSTPQIVNDNKLDKIKYASLNNTPRNPRTPSKSKEIDIEAIKKNFKKILNRKIDDSSLPEKETTEEFKRNVKRSISPKKKTTSNESKHNFSISNDISFIENDSLTIENKEIEISNILPVPKKYESNSKNSIVKCKNKLSTPVSSLHCNKPDCEYSNNPADTLATKGSKIIIKQSKSGIDHPLKEEQKSVNEKVTEEDFSQQKTKKVLKSPTYKNEISVENEETVKSDVKVRKSPKKKTQETDFVLSSSKQSSRSLLGPKEQQSEEQKDSTQYNEENEKLIPGNFHESSHSDKKRMLRSSLNNSNDFESLKANNLMLEEKQMSEPSEKHGLFNIDDSSKLNCNCTNEEPLINSINKIETEKLEILKRNLKSNSNENINLSSEHNLVETSPETNEEIVIEKKSSEKTVRSNKVATRKRILRSTSQENLVKEIQEENSEISLKNISQNYLNEEIRTDVKVNLKKLEFGIDIQSIRLQESAQASANIQETVFPTDKNEKIKDERTKSAKPTPEIVLQKCNIDTNTPPNYDESLPTNKDVADKMMSPLKKGKKSVPEIRIIISPLNFSLLGKVPEIPCDMSDSPSKMKNISPSKRKLRSMQAIIGSTKSDNEHDCRKTPSKNKTIPEDINKELKMPGIDKENSLKVSIVQKKPIDYIVSKSNKPDLNSLDQFLNKELDIDINTSIELKVEEHNLSKLRTPRKNKGTSNIKTISNDVDKIMDSYISVSKFYANNLRDESTKELEKCDFINTKIKQNSECNIVKSQKQKVEKTSVVNARPRKATNISIMKPEFINFENTDYNCETAKVVTKSSNIDRDHDSDNINNKERSQEFNCNTSQIGNTIDSVSSKSMMLSNNLENNKVEESTLKISTENGNSTIKKKKQRNETTGHVASNESEEKNCVELESNLQIENISMTKTYNSLVKSVNIEKQTEIYENEDQLRIETTPKTEKLKECITSNKLVTIKINPCDANNYLTEKYEGKCKTKTLDLIREGLIEENTKPTPLNGETAKLNNVCLDLDMDLLKNMAENKKGFKKTINKSNVPIMSDPATERLKSKSAKDSSGEINIIDTKLGVDDSIVNKAEIRGQLVKDCITIVQNESRKLVSCDLVTTITECESIQESEEDCLELAEIFDKTENTENGDNSSLRNNNVTSNQVSTGTSSMQNNVDNEENKLIDMIPNISQRNTKMPKDLLMNEENVNENSTPLIRILSKESTQPKDKSTAKVEIERIFSPRLRERKMKSISNQRNSSILEESPRSTKNDSVNKVSTETSTERNQPTEYLEHSDNANLKNVTSNNISNRISRRSAFNRIPDNAQNVLPKKGTQTNSDDRFKSDRPLIHRRRKSINDIDLSDTEREQYKDRLRRSKSVITIPRDSKKKINNRDDSKMSRKKVDTCDDIVKVDTEVKKIEHKSKLKRSKSFSQSNFQSRNRNVDRGSVFTENLKKSEEFVDRKKPKEIKGRISQEVREKTNTDLENEDTSFQVGDLAWAQIGSHPFWPCLVIEEPETETYKKKIIFQGKRNERILYHVRFFGDNGRRAWINKHQMMLYSNRNDLKVLSDQVSIESYSSTLLRAYYVVKPNKLRKWECAVDEAEHLKSKNIHERVSFFTDMFASRAEKKQKQLLSEDSGSIKSESSLVKRKRKEMDHNEEKFELSSNIDSTSERSPIRKKLKKESPSGTNIDTESITDLPKKDNNIVSQIENSESSVLQNENVLSSRLRLRKQIDEISEIDSKTSSDNTTDHSLYSMAFQKALFKRNNLFKGVPRDKVCQYCCEPEAVLKCRGRCNGSYHVECATRMLQEKLDKKKKSRNISQSLLHEHETLHENKKIDEASKPIKEEEIPEQPKKDERKLGFLEDDHVQIITVPSSVYNTPPRRTFPPNFKNMTLAEQIDYKMKEIMKKFESKTFYAETTDSSSEENSLIQPLSKAKNFSRCVALFPNSSTFDKESKANLIEEQNIDNEVLKNEPALDAPSSSGIVEKLTKSKNININSENKKKKSKRITKQKHFVAHVTADFDSLDFSKTDTIHEDHLNVTESANIGNTVNAKNFKCGFCVSDSDPFCFICDQAISKRGSSIRQKCSLYQCGRFYHPNCLKMWPQTQWSLIQTTKHKDSDEAVDSFVCPLHVCHTCASDDPRAAMSRCSGDKIVKCLRCPSTYHSTNFCVPAGTTILSSTQIICPRHREKSKSYTINTTWCFLCSEGGNLICCETCPTSVHPECLPVNLTEDDKFICEDCESGRLPLYDEIVWVKLGRFRWWPALILFPNEIPVNIMNIKHATGEFVVKFFGTYDHYWVNRGRSFLFQEGDTGHCNSTKSKVDAAFNKAVEEAVVAHKAKKEFKLNQEAESITSLKPPPYIRIKVNKPVGNVRQMDLDLSSTNACECDPSRPNPCGPDSDCLNRLLLTECSPDVCPAGQRCKNQSFDKREYPPLIPYKTQGRGWGLKTLAPIKKGQFVIEYVGEMIDIEEYQRRIQKMHEQKEENYYFLTIDKDRMLDAGPKGNVARFMNHCCQPNCETQKWTVNGDTRVGLFATEDISADTELTFNYNLECVGKEKKVCRCGAPNCSGFIGVKAKQETDSKKPKKSYKKKKAEEPVILPPCFVCGKKGKVGVCNNKVCNNAYHLKCLKMTEWPEGNKFICPWHNCNTCSKRTIRCCVKCVNSFCPSHSEGNVRYDNLLGFVCNIHDPLEAPNDDEPVKLKKKKNNVITDESAVTSTTADEFDEEDLDLLPLTVRKSKNRRKKKEIPVSSESDNDFEVNKSLTSTPRRTVCSNRDSQDESTVSSATATDVDESILVKRKRGRPRKEDQTKKKRKVNKINNVENHESTANSSLKDDNSLRNSSNCELSSSDNELENR